MYLSEDRRLIINKEKLDKSLAAVDCVLEDISDAIAELICERQSKNVDMTDDVFVERINRLRQKIEIYQQIKVALEYNQYLKQSFSDRYGLTQAAEPVEAPAETPAEEAPKEEVPEAPAETPKPKRSSRRKGVNVNE